MIAQRGGCVAAAVSCAILCAALVCCWMTLAGPRDVTFRQGSGTRRAVTLPYADANASTTQPMEFTFRVRRYPLTPRSFVFKPDDHLLSISVNGHDQSLSGLPPEKLDDYQRGFSYPLRDSLARGDNVVVVRVMNRGGSGGIDVWAEPAPLVEVAVVSLAAAAAIALLVIVLHIAGAATADGTLPALGHDSPTDATRWGVPQPSGELRRHERLLTTCLVLLKLDVLYDNWGVPQGFDRIPWIDVFRVTQWFRPFPDPKSMFASYHPPLSYLLARCIFRFYPHEVECSQILSTAAMLVALLALRSTLRTIGVLWTLAGFVMFYCAASLPLLVWLAIETSYDSLVFMWVVLALAISVKLFWAPVPRTWWRSPRYLAGIVSLGLVLAAGLLTKFNTLFAFGLPCIVLVVRRGRRIRLRELGLALAPIALGALLAAPLYYTRYYKPLGVLFPSAMDWRRADDLAAARKLRDADRLRFALNLVRFPREPIVGSPDPVRDSFIHSIWFQTWKRDSIIGPQSKLSLAVSDLYARASLFFVLPGTLLLFLRRRKLPQAWRDLGWVLLPLSAAYCLSLLYFGWKYPLWDWEPFKAKYITPALLWIPYCIGFVTVAVSSRSTHAIRFG
ncbi:MAG: hypothetical protein ACRENE_27755, partial [Polyangiaceae bacterium]